MENSKKYLLICSLAFLFVSGVLLLFSKPLTSLIQSYKTESYRIHNIDPEIIKTNQQLTAEMNPSQVTFDYASVEPISPQSIAKSQFSAKKFPVISQIAIPSVSINLPIFLGVSSDALLYGAGTLSPTQKLGLGNYGLISHLSYDPDALFSPLQRIELGASIYVTDLANVYSYQVVKKEQIQPDDLWILDEIPGKTLITLITCADFQAKNRLAVQGELQWRMPLDKISSETAAIFDL